MRYTYVSKSLLEMELLGHAGDAGATKIRPVYQGGCEHDAEGGDETPIDFMDDFASFCIRDAFMLQVGNVRAIDGLDLLEIFVGFNHGGGHLVD